MSIHDQILEVSVLGCSKLIGTEWISRQDPFICLEYANTQFWTRICTDGVQNHFLSEKFVFKLIEGLREIRVAVYKRNSPSPDDFIGGGQILLHKVLSHGFDAVTTSIQGRRGEYVGEITVKMSFPRALFGMAAAPLIQYPFRAFPSYRPPSYLPSYPLPGFPPTAYAPPRSSTGSNLIRLAASLISGSLFPGSGFPAYPPY